MPSNCLSSGVIFCYVMFKSHLFNVFSVFLQSRFLIELLYCYNVFLKTCLVILKTVFLFCDNYIAMTYFTQVDTRLKDTNSQEQNTGRYLLGMYKTQKGEAGKYNKFFFPYRRQREIKIARHAILQVT